MAAAIGPLCVTGAEPHRELVNAYCLACHSESLRTGGLALDELAARPVDEDRGAWETVVRKLRGRHMPPVGLPRPDESTYGSVVAWLEERLDAAAARNPDPGRTETFRRLTRTEYRNAIRDLLALDVDLSTVLPRDESSSGFDNITVGDLSPALLEAYVAAADSISRLALGRPVPTPVVRTVKMRPDLTQEWPVEGLPLGTRGGTLVKHTFPVDGQYEIIVRLARDRDEQIEGLRARHQLDLLLDGERIRLFDVVPPRRVGDHDDVDHHLRARLPVRAGTREIAATFVKQPWSVLETDRLPYQAHFNVYRHPRVQPAVYEVTIMGPYGSTGPGNTASRERILTCGPESDDGPEGCAKEILANVMRLAFRRDVSASDLEGPLEFFRDGLAEEGFEAGIEMALSSILISPDFLFRIERDPPGLAPGTPYRLSDGEIASRLSFFLWSSIPDKELLGAARLGQLRNPEHLERQVRRMLADRRSSTVLTNFAAQWLHLRNLDAAERDMRLFPSFDDNLRQAMRRETELFLESVIREDRSVLDLLSADYTFLNERLARHYSIPHVYGSWFRRVDLGQASRRGGLLRHASILTVTSYSTRTSPVIRGHWILENLLGVPPPPPPSEVPALEDQPIASGLSVRERLERHRADPACASCHALMDPVGFALDNYDAVGRWRTHEGGVPVDIAGNFPGGPSFEGVEGLETAILERSELFVGALAEKLLTYALGRVVGPLDGPAVRRIVREARDDGFSFSSLVLGVVKSDPFQMRRTR
ncbi:MAG: DUF1592 domain-containing protein [Bryobacterales bacterium]|nr:DUF1592 domain-containing protein [Bryobacterales bacterium]